MVYVNINLVSMDGGWKSTATGLSGYQGVKAHHNVHTMRHSKSFMDQESSELHRSNWRQGDIIKAHGPKIFQIETTLNTNLFGHDGPMSVLAEARVGMDRWSTGPPSPPCRPGLKRMSPPGPPPGLPLLEAPPTTSPRCRPARWKPCTARPPNMVYKQHLVPVEGQTDIVTMGLPYLTPYNVNSIMNPILVMVQGLGYFFNLYRGRPVVREGGVLIMSHPTPWEFHPVHHPSYIDFFEQVLADTTDPVEIEQRYEKQFAEDEWYRHLYRTSYAYHGVHPFYMWYWGSHALQHLGQVIVVGGDERAVRRLGFKPASTLSDALEMSSDVVGSNPTITHLHNPPILMADVS